MAQVTVTINGRPYPVACNDGEEARIGELARYIDGKVKHFAREFGGAGEARLLLMAALLLADELADARETGGRSLAGNGAELDGGALARGVENIAQRIEAVAARLEASQI